MLNIGGCVLSVSVLHYSTDRNQQREMGHFISNCQCGVSHPPHLTFTCITGPCNYSRLTRTCGGGVPAPSPPSQEVRSTGDFYVWSLCGDQKPVSLCGEGLQLTHESLRSEGRYSSPLCLVPHLVPIIRSLHGGHGVDLFTPRKKICYRYHCLKSMMVWEGEQGERAYRGRRTEKVRYRTRLFHIKS